MEKFVRGDVVVVPFPYTDLSGAKRRPAIAVSNSVGEDVILCQITTKHGENSIKFSQTDMESGKMEVESFIKPARIFTISNSLIVYKLGRATKKKQTEISKSLVKLFAENE